MTENFNNGYNQGLTDHEHLQYSEISGLDEQYLAGYSVARAEISCEKACDTNSFPYFLGLYVGYYGIDERLMDGHYSQERQDIFQSGLIDGKDDNVRENQEEYCD
ncbi:hypothetical protein [Atlantibacter hermannii]|uniref:hypothetical protein n=1 Tax=Atlantibacter hermannii TaxID=565 RepID=UPI003076335E